MGANPAKVQRLRQVEQDLKGLRQELQPPADEPRDFADQGADLNQREELAAQIEVLQNERARLREDLGL